MWKDGVQPEGFTQWCLSIIYSYMSVLSGFGSFNTKEHFLECFKHIRHKNSSAKT